MYNSFQSAIKYIHYLAIASNSKGHGIHSPFIYQFITQVLNDRNQYEAYGKVENRRRELLNNTSLIDVDDPGAGSSFTKSGKRTISSIARNSAKSKKYGNDARSSRRISRKVSTAAASGRPSGHIWICVYP